MALGDVKDFVQSLAPTWLSKGFGEALMLMFGLIADAHAEGAREATAQRFILHCAADALNLHGKQVQILRAPGETTEQFRARLAAAWEAWSKAGTGGGILLQLEPAGVTSATIHEGDSIDPDVPASWAKWWLEVSDPHPFTPPITYGSGRRYGDGALYGFGDGSAIAYTRAVIRKWQPAHVLCTGVLVHFSAPAIDIRLPVPWT